MKTFAERVLEACREKDSLVCVGLDPRPNQLPASFLPGADAPAEVVAQAFVTYSEQVLDLVAPHAAAVKPQAAFFEALGPAGFGAFHEVCAAARRRGLLVIADVKRGDIGTTAEAYAEAWLGARAGQALVADACTVNPYLGSDGIRPFLEAAVATNGGVFVLVKTSNPSSSEIQDRKLEGGERVYVHLARLVAQWNQPIDATGYGPLGAVAGATWPDALAEIRRLLPASLLLVPGYGAQGGTAQDVVAGCDRSGGGILVNASRSITFPWGRREHCPRDWHRSVTGAVCAMQREINDARAARG